MDEVISPVQLKDGRRLEVELAGTAGSMIAVAVRLTGNGKTVAEVGFPFPRPGLGGGHIVLSPSQRFAVVSMFSGQSEEGYELFRVGAGLERIARMDYEPGEVASFCFSTQEDFLLMALPDRCCEWWQPWEEGETEPDGEDRLSFRFGQVRVLEIETNTVSVHEIRVSIGEGWEPSDTPYDPELKPHLEAKRFLLSMPWGEAEIPVPIAKTVVVRIAGDEPS